MNKPDVLYFQLYQVKSKPKQCYSIVVLRCPESGEVNAGLYIDFANSGEMSRWDTAFSMEELGLLRLFLICMLLGVGMSWRYLREVGEMELQGVHAQLLILGKTMYVSWACAMVCWGSYYGLYSVTGMPSVLLKALGVYSQWVFELAALGLLSLNATGYFLRDQALLLEVRIVLLVNALMTLYLSLRKALESEAEVQFHWYWDTTCYTYTRLLTSIVLILWSRNGYKQLSEGLKDKALYGKMLVAGAVWMTVQPVGLVVIRSCLERFRWKYCQAGLTVVADLALCSWLLTVLNSSVSSLLFSKETAIQTLKPSHSRL